MSNIIYKNFYTYQFIDNDLHIYTWKFLEDWGKDEMAYINEASGNITYVTSYQDPQKFETENDVFLDYTTAAQEAQKHMNGSVDFEFDEYTDEGRAWFQSLEEFYDIEDEEGDE